MDLETSEDGSETFATLQLDEDIKPKASLVWKQLVKGTLRWPSLADAVVRQLVQLRSGAEISYGV